LHSCTALKILITLFFFINAASLRTSQWRPFSKTLGFRVAIDSLQHEVHNEIYGIDTLYDH